MAFGIVRSEGWYIENSEGLATIYLSIVDEGYTTQSTDTPSSKAHRPRILNADTFSIRRSASFWPWGRSSVQQAAFGSLAIDNYDGAFDFLLGADLRDATVIFHLPPAASLGGATTINDLDPIATAVLENVTSDQEDIITLTLKDTLARLDKPLPCRYNPPFVDSNAANRMVPITLGACRNVAPLLIDEANRIYQLGDAQITNIAAMRDKGAPLDPYSDPPQYSPALNSSGVQLDVLPEGKLTCDISSEGAQVVIPGDEDVLDGEGILDVWTTATDPPDNWSYISGTTNAHVIRRGVANSFSQDYVAWLFSNQTYNTSGSIGRGIVHDDAILKGGRSYRISFTLERYSGSQSILPQGVGFLLRSDITGPIYGAGAISGRYPLTAPQFGSQPYTFVYTVPVGADRNVYALAVGDPAHSDIYIGFSGLKIEEIGEYFEAPVTGITLANYFTEILKNRAGEDSSVWNASDLDSIDAATGYLFGVHFDDQPNILEALRMPLDSFCGTMFTDADGVIRTRRLVDPSEGPVVADFDETNVDRPVRVSVDSATELTTLIGARRNWSVFGDSDFVTDELTVPLDVRDRYKRLSQYQQTSSVVPAGQYSHAIGAPVFDSLLDDPENAQVEIDRIVSLYAWHLTADGQIHNGKRRFVRFTARFDDEASVGATVKVAARDLLVGDVVSLSYPGNGDTPKFDDTRLFVSSVELFPFAQKITIEGWY
jgi:hypothetical protein